MKGIAARKVTAKDKIKTSNRFAMRGILPPRGLAGNYKFIDKLRSV